MRRKGTFLFVCVLCSAYVVWGDPSDGNGIGADGERTVGIVRYAGDFKTSERELARVTGLRSGMPLADVDAEEVKRRLAATGLYSEIGVESAAADGGAVVTVTLTEKWTLIPIPVASFSEDSTMIGLIVIDSDFLGSRSVFMGGGVWTADGPYGILRYADPSVGASGVGLDFAAQGGFESTEAAYRDKETFLSFDDRAARLFARLTFREGAKIRPFAGASFSYLALDGDDAGREGLDDAYSYAEAEAGLALEGTRNRDWFDAGARGEARAYRAFDLSGSDPYVGLAARISYTGEFAFAGALRVGAAAETSGRPVYLAPALGGSGFRTLPQGSSRSSRYAGAYAAYERPFARPGWGTLTLRVFYEGGAYETGREGAERGEYFHGPGAGFRLYLKKVAIPALGLDLGYNVAEGYPVFAATLGFGGE